MKGTMVTIQPNGTVMEKQLDGPPTVEQMNAVLGGYMELIPRFDTYGGRRCVAFCNEDGKNMNLPFNYPAHTQWEMAIGRMINLNHDHLVGTVVVIYGDDELMEAL